MRYKTNFEAVQSVALSLLYTPIHETKFSPMVVQHLFTSSAFVAIKNKMLFVLGVGLLANSIFLYTILIRELMP